MEQRRERLKEWKSKMEVNIEQVNKEEMVDNKNSWTLENEEDNEEINQENVKIKENDEVEMKNDQGNDVDPLDLYMSEISKEVYKIYKLLFW